MRRALLALLVATGCSKSEKAPDKTPTASTPTASTAAKPSSDPARPFGVDTSTWQPMPLPASFKTPGTLRLPPTSKLDGTTFMLPDGNRVFLLERTPEELAAPDYIRNGEVAEGAFSSAPNKMLDTWRSPTAYVFIHQPAGLKGDIAIAATNFTVEPGINCSHANANAPTLDQARIIGAVCASLAPK